MEALEFMEWLEFTRTLFVYALIFGVGFLVGYITAEDGGK